MLQIFIGSSTESLPALDFVALCLEEQGITPIRWDKPGLFPPGDYTFGRLTQIAREVDAAVFVFGEDDRVWYRGDTRLQPRDNVLVEYGLFAGALGVQRSIICVDGKPKHSSDLAGMTYVDISEGRRNRARLELRSWINHISGLPAVQRSQSPSTIDVEELTASCFRSVHRMFYQHSAENQDVTVHEYRHHLTINKYGDCECVETRRQTAKIVPHSMELIPVGSTSELKNFGDMWLRCSVLSPAGRSVVAFPAMNEPQSKEFLLYYLPAMEVGEEHVIEFSWRWPAMFGRLATGQPEEWTIKPNATWKVEKHIVVIDLAEALPKLEITNSGQGGGSCQVATSQDKFVRYIWTSSNLRPASVVNLELKPHKEATP